MTAVGARKGAVRRALRGRRRIPGTRPGGAGAVDTLGAMVSPVDALTPKVQAALRAALGEQYLSLIHI